MPDEPPFVSYAQNGEDVVLWRALRHVRCGTYVDVGAADPVVESVTKAFYDRGWRGLNVEPTAAYAERLRAERPEDVNVAAVATAVAGEVVTLNEIPQTGLSTLDPSLAARHESAGWTVTTVQVPTVRLEELLDAQQWRGREIHFLKVDTEGSEPAVLAGVDLRAWRPWVLVVEATEPNSATPSHQAWEPVVLAAGYRFCLFDGLSRFYVAEEHADELAPALAYPACVLDRYLTRTELGLRQDLDQAHQEHRALVEQVVLWRQAALRGWSDSMAHDRSPEAQLLQQRVDELLASTSWRVTKPLRMAQDLRLRARPSAR